MNTMHTLIRASAAISIVAALSGVGSATSEANASPLTPAGVHATRSAPATVEVQMIGDQSGYRFSPASITIKPGDRVRWTLVSGPPHNVAFWTDSVPKGTAAKLGKNMAQTVGPLTGPYLLTPGQSYVVSFAGLPAGTYKYNCTPHLALGMVGVVRVK